LLLLMMMVMLILLLSSDDKNDITPLRYLAQIDIHCSTVRRCSRSTVNARDVINDAHMDGRTMATAAAAAAAAATAALMRQHIVYSITLRPIAHLTACNYVVCSAPP